MDMMDVDAPLAMSRNVTSNVTRSVPCTCYERAQTGFGQSKQFAAPADQSCPVHDRRNPAWFKGTMGNTAPGNNR